MFLESTKADATALMAISEPNRLRDGRCLLCVSVTGDVYSASEGLEQWLCVFSLSSSVSHFHH